MMGFSVRGLALGALATLVLAAVPATAAAAAAAPAVAAITASPDSNLRDGQAITVTGTGYPANAELDLVQCVEGQGCDFSELLLPFTDANGGYTATFYAKRIMTLDGGVQVDCAVAQNCILVSLDISDLSTGAQTSITFDPNAPIRPPLHFLIAPDPIGGVHVDNGVARVTGTVKCNEPVEIQLNLELEQVYQRQIFQSYTFLDVTCSRDGHFAAVFRPQNGLFGEGAAKLFVDGFGTSASSYELTKHVIVTLQSR